jgi:hypothetical protein
MIRPLGRGTFKNGIEGVAPAVDAAGKARSDHAR